jgi:hypothetical protein
MTTLSHSNFFAHRMLTDQGAYTHEHYPESFEDVGDAESGPQLTGGPAYDRYAGESHEIIIDYSGMIRHCVEIDWNWERFLADAGELASPDDGAEYIRKRASGEDWQVTFTDEDGKWFACWGGTGWTDERAEDVGFFTMIRASQIAYRFNHHARYPCGPARIKAVAPGIHHYKSFAVQCRYWTHAELVKIDQELSWNRSGASHSQAPGFYFDEVDDETGAAAGTPTGPYASELEAYGAWRKMAEKVI